MLKYLANLVFTHLVEKCIRTFRRSYKFVLLFLNLLSDLCNFCAKNRKHVFSSVPFIQGQLGEKRKSF